MKYSITRHVPVLLCCLGIGSLEAQVLSETTTFAQPAKYCFEQTQLRGTRDKLILEHHLLVDEEDHFKTGDVFVAVRFKSTGKVLLTNGISWRGLDVPGPLNVYRTHGQLDGVEVLQPVMPISVFYTPMDVTPVGGDAQIFVGYGLRAEADNFRVAFDEMISSKRYTVLWDSGAPGLGLGGISYNICLRTTAMTKSLITVSAGPVKVDSVFELQPVPRE